MDFSNSFHPERVAVVGATPREGSIDRNSRLALDVPEVGELEVNPLLATPDAVTPRVSGSPSIRARVSGVC